MRRRFARAALAFLAITVSTTLAGTFALMHAIGWLATTMVPLTALSLVLAALSLLAAAVPVRPELRDARSTTGTRTLTDVLAYSLLLTPVPSPSRDRQSLQERRRMRVAGALQSHPHSRPERGFVLLDPGAEDPVLWVPGVKSRPAKALRPAAGAPLAADPAVHTVPQAGRTARSLSLFADGSRCTLFLSATALPLVLTAYQQRTT